MKDKLNICIFYLCVHKRIDEKVGLSRIMLKETFYIMLGEVYHIPKPLRVVILKEMITYGMLEDVDKKCIKVAPLLSDPEENINKFYKEIGLWD
jgi:hypothetical protein|tara:strand:- start:1896 stop:2177 length:282 start_codon:yes stop_codon:yes gene_type:complete